MSMLRLSMNDIDQGMLNQSIPEMVTSGMIPAVSMPDDMPPQPFPIQNEMAVEVPQMPQAQVVNPMIAPQANQNPMAQYQPVFNALGAFANQINDAQMRENLPADVYLKYKGQQIEQENAQRDNLLKSLQLDADIKYKQQSLDIQREQNAISREALLRGGDDPAAIKQTAWYLNAPPEQRAIYDRVNKIGLDSVDIGGKTVFVDKVAGNIVAEVEKTLAPGETPETRRAQASATEVGKEEGIAKAKLQSMQASYPGLIEVTDKLSKLGQIATYTKAGQIKDEAARQLGMDIPDSAVARTAYMATVNDEVLPLLRETFGAAFTVQEGDKLLSTLGDPNKSPKEKDAALFAFIDAKDREIKKLQRQTGADVTGGAGMAPAGIDPEDFKYLTPEERILFGVQ